MSRTTPIPWYAKAFAYAGACIALFVASLGFGSSAIGQVEVGLAIALSALAAGAALSQATLSRYTAASISDLPLLSAVLLLPPSLAVVVAIAAGAIPHGRLGRLSRAVNVTALALPVALSSVAFLGLRDVLELAGPGDGPVWWLGAALVAVAVFPLTHHPLMSLWNKLAYGVSFRECLRDGALPLLKADPVSALLVIPLCETGLLLSGSARVLPVVLAFAGGAGMWLLLAGARRQVESRAIKDEFFRAIFVSFARLLEMKDPETARHSARVAVISRELARALGLGKEDQSRIHLAGLLHDVGKVGVPDEILLKTGRLSDDERIVMQRHARLSAEAIAGIPGFSDLTRMVYAHHERVNGSGYPEGIGGADLPLGARILGVADTFEALTSDRSYRVGRSFEEALEVFEAEHYLFDPEVVEAMKHLVHFGFVEFPQGGLHAFSSEWSQAARHLEVRLDEEPFEVPPEAPPGRPRLSDAEQVESIQVEGRAEPMA